MLAEDHLGESDVGTVAREVVKRGNPVRREGEVHPISRAAAFPASFDYQREERRGQLALPELERYHVKHSTAAYISVRELPAGGERGEGLQVGGDGDKSGGFLSFAAVPRRVEDAIESGVGHEPCSGSGR